MSKNNQAVFEQLCEFTTKLMEAKGVPGVAVGVLHQGETHTAGFGVTNVDHPQSVTDETLFQIGSITKTFTGTAIMRLVEMGKLDLDATVRTYVPKFKVSDETAASQATIRHLLTHTSGWEGDFFYDTGAGDDALVKYVAEMAELQQLAPLGTVHSYNNSGFSLAGYVIEKVTAKSYQAALAELVLEPLGLENCFFDPGDLITYRFVVGHDVTERGAQVIRPWALPRALYPLGGIVCHVRDLLHYARFHLGDGSVNGGTRLLQPESLSLMQTPQVAIWGEKEARGLSWFINDEGGARQISHSGGTKGQVSLLLLVPEHEFAIVILTNAEQGDEVTRKVSRWALKHYLGVEIKDPEPIESSGEELAAYVGHYVRPYAEMELGMLGGRLIGQVVDKKGFPTQDTPPPPPPPPMSLALCEPGRLLVLDGPFKDMLVDVIRGPDGAIRWMRADGRIYGRES